MRVSQSTYTERTGWRRGQEDLGADAKLVLAFGPPEVIAARARWEELRTRHPDAILLGCSTGGEIHGPEALDDTLSVTAFDFVRTGLRSAHADLEHMGDSFATGQAVGEMLHASDLVAVFVLSDGTKVNGSDLVRGLRAATGDNVVITGGLAGDGPRFGSTLVGLDADPCSGRIAAVGFYGGALQVRHGSAGGWDVFGPERAITRAEGNVLYELDGKPALDLYKRYLGEDADGLPGSALLFPLRIYPAERPNEAIVRTIVGIDEDARTMTFAGDMPQGFRAQLMRGNFDRLVEGAANAAEQADAPYSGDRAAVLVSCIGRKLLLGQRIREEVEAVHDVLGPGTPLAGFYSYGEVSPHAGTGFAELHNQTMTITIFSEHDGA